jgi:predicted nuclease with TOPRIM domain
MPSDEQIREVIERLEGEREELRRREGASDPNFQQDAARLEEIRVELDQLWDLLRQRQALRDAGDDPEKAHERSGATVENYWQ